MSIDKISVIVPVYKVENDLNKCVDSILGQTYSNLEVILVNDGSPDNSGKICDEYAKSDKRVIAIHKENEGSSCARNAGLDIATGEFIAFVDSDDYIDETMFEKMIALSSKHHLDVVEIASRNFSDIVNYDNSFKIEDNISALERTISRTSFSVWRRIYRRSVVKDMRFIPKIIHQDVFYTIDVMNNVSSVGFLNSPLYIYNNLGESIIRSKYSKHKIEIGIRATEYIENNIPNDERLKRAFDNYRVSYYTDHYFLLSRNTKVDPNGIYRKKLKQNIKSSLKRATNKNLRTSMVINLPAKVMELVSSTYEFLKKG